VCVRPLCVPPITKDPALMLHAADDPAGGLQRAVDVDTNDEGNEAV